MRQEKGCIIITITVIIIITDSIFIIVIVIIFIILLLKKTVVSLSRSSSKWEKRNAEWHLIHFKIINIISWHRSRRPSRQWRDRRPCRSICSGTEGAVGNRARRPPVARKARGRRRNSRRLILLSPFSNIKGFDFWSNYFLSQILARCGSEVGADAGAERPRFLFSFFFGVWMAHGLNTGCPDSFGATGCPCSRVLKIILNHSLRILSFNHPLILFLELILLIIF